MELLQQDNEHLQKQHTANILHAKKRPNAEHFLPFTKEKARMSTLAFNLGFQILANVSKQEKETKEESK